MTTLRRALVTGGSGLIGRHVLRALVERSPALAVGVVTRRPDALPPLPPGHRAIELDLSRSIDIEDDFDLVIHCAGEIRDSGRMAQTNVEGTRHLLDWAIRRGVQRFIHFSSVAVYGAAAGRNRVDERSPHAPDNPYAVSKELSEDMVRQRCGEHGIDHVILQPANVISLRPFTEDHLLNLMRQIQRGRFRHFRGPDAVFNYIGAEAVANVVTACIDEPLAGRTFILNTPHRLHDVVGWIAEELAVDIRPRPWPRAIGAAAGAVFDGAARISGRSMPFSLARFRELTNARVFDAAAVAAAFPGAQTPGLEATVRALARRYLAEGKLDAVPGTPSRRCA
ncbi:NAD-dependent epimerase/dehydratase family protein [Ramlibacter sp.]|uniref:NAD-dependent epimerase/dehydratase family protein n=1 Tax=Ramlibacter sp. TaxID=1917967 RepID=UPI003D0A6079